MPIFQGSAAHDHVTAQVDRKALDAVGHEQLSKIVGNVALGDPAYVERACRVLDGKPGRLIGRAHAYRVDVHMWQRTGKLQGTRHNSLVKIPQARHRPHGDVKAAPASRAVPASQAHKLGRLGRDIDRMGGGGMGAGDIRIRSSPR